MATLVGRGALLAEVADLVQRGESVALHGPVGVGKSAVLDAVDVQATTQGMATVRVNGAPDEHALPFATLRDLLDQVPEDLLGHLPESVRTFVAGGLVGRPVTDQLRSDLAAGVHAVFAAWTARQPVLLLLDDLQHLDAESSTAVGYARRRLRGSLAVVATVGPGDGVVDLPDLADLEVAPLEEVAMVDLLTGHGLAPDVAHRVHGESGGIAALALALAGAIGPRPSVLGRPPPLPSSIERMLRERYLRLDEEVRATLAHAALLHRPGLRELERTGRMRAEDDVRTAELAGLVVRVDDVVRFTPSQLPAVIGELLSARERADIHQALAEVAGTPAEQQRHLALADPRPDGARAEALAAAAEEADLCGARDLAAELYLLAADRAPLALATERLGWLVAAVEAAAPANATDLVSRALADLQHRGGATPEQAVRARLAIPELAGHGVATLDEVLVAALTDAGDDDRLVARVLLQRARIALMESRPQVAVRFAERAVDLLAAEGEDDEVALGLTTLAVSRRWVGLDHATPLARAVALAGESPSGFLHTSPEYMAARFAFYDDRLEEAWSAFLSMLARVERDAGTDHLHVLRCLVEVAARSGRCREALDYADRATRIGQEFDLDPHTLWFVTAQAEVAGGDLDTALTLAERGAQAAEERGDTRYLQRHLVLVGQCRLRRGEAALAHEALARVAATEEARGASDPTVNRWQADMVSALVALGRLEEATRLVDEVRYALGRREAADGVGAQLDRAEAELLVARGELDAADVLLERAGKVATDLGMRLDAGRVLLGRAHLERRRRRAAAARGALERAGELFDAVHAASWSAQVRRELDPRGCGADGPGDDPLLERLTAAEARIAREVAQGASNREIAERAYVSVKTVEATLTRIYRKLEVRSRTQLAALLVPASD